MSEFRTLHPIPAPSATSAVIASGDKPAMIALQERLIERAICAGASDLHVEPFPERLRLRVRVDGLLHELDPLPSWMHPGLAARFKVLCDMDVTERRCPQDGRTSVRSGQHTVDLRVSTLPTQFGEKVVVRLLPRSVEPLALEELGLDAERLACVEEFIEQPYGLILAAGPTGAGKTTTLYALLRRIDAVGRNIVTLEDPIEYRLPNAVQVAVQRTTGVDFAGALRAVLRQDPDVILVGEIRDEETARVAVRSAITGHLVLSSVHTNSAPDSAARLIELGVPGHLLASGLIGVISQRLVRRLCPGCRAPQGPLPETAARLRLPDAGDGGRYYTATGCSSCRSGFAGRIGLFETLSLGRNMSRALASGADSHGLERQALRCGALLPLRTSAIAALRAGATSIEEVARVLPYLGEATERA